MGLEPMVTTGALLGPLSQLPLSVSELWFLYLQQEETDLGLGLTQLEIKIVGTPGSRKGTLVANGGSRSRYTINHAVSQQPPIPGPSVHSSSPKLSPQSQDSQKQPLTRHIQKGAWA